MPFEMPDSIPPEWGEMTWDVMCVEAESHPTSGVSRDGLTDRRQVSTLEDLHSTPASQLREPALPPLPRGIEVPAHL